MDRYVNFDLVIDREDDNYVARVIDSPAGEATAQFPFPFSRLELENYLLRVGQSNRSMRRIDSPQMEAARQFGGKLYDTVFSGEVRTCFRRALDEADRQEQGLRLRVRFDDALDMADLPWEYLYSSGLGRFLVLSTQTPLVRYIDLPTRIRPLEVAPPLRILVMVSSPTDYLNLDVENEYRRLAEALDDLVQSGRVELDRLDEASLSKLQQRLRQGTYHIFHYVGHGGFDEQRDDGVLMLEDEQGRGRAVSGHELGTILHDHRSLRLAVLNSCEGARTSTSDPFAGTAQSLVQQGIPAVIAMQFEISDDAAILFAHEFYAAVADGYPVDAATAEARKAMFTNAADVEWGTPVLNMRSPDGMVFDVQGDPVAREPAPDGADDQSPSEPLDSGPETTPDEEEPATDPVAEPSEDASTDEPGDVRAATEVLHSHPMPPVPPPMTEGSTNTSDTEEASSRPAAFAAPVSPPGPTDVGTTTPTPKKGVPTWAWVVGGVLGTLLILGVIGALIPEETPATTTPNTLVTIPNTVPDTVPNTIIDEVFVERPGPEAHAEPLFSFDADGWPLWDTQPTDIQVTPHVVFAADEWDGEVDHGTAWRFGWDSDFLYAQITVADDFYFQDQFGATSFRGDSLNLDFDTDLAGDETSARPDGDDFQVIVSVGSVDILPNLTLFQGDGSIFTPTAFQTSSAVRWFPMDSTLGLDDLEFAGVDQVFYAVDVAILWDEMGIVPEPGMRIGFRVSANDNDLGFALQEVMYSNAANSSLFDTRTWGTLVLD